MSLNYVMRKRRRSSEQKSKSVFTAVYISGLTRIFKFIILPCNISAGRRQNVLLKCSLSQEFREL